MDPMEQVASLVALLPEETQCQIFSNITSLKDIAKLLRISRDFNRVGKACIETLEADKETEVNVDLLLQFPHLKHLNNIVVPLNNVEDAAKMATLTDLQKAVFSLPALKAYIGPASTAPFEDEILSTYINTLCSQVGKSLLGRHLTFITRDRYPEVVSLDGVNIWHSGAYYRLNPRSILDCTGLREIIVRPILQRKEREQLYQNTVGSDVKLIVLPLERTWLNEDTLKLLQRLNYGNIEPNNPDSPTVKSQLQLFDTQMTDRITLYYLLLLGLINEGSVWNFDYIAVPRELSALASAPDARRRRMRPVDAYVSQGQLFRLLDRLNDKRSLLEEIKRVNPNIVYRNENDAKIVLDQALLYIDAVKDEIRADQQRQTPKRRSHNMIRGTRMPEIDPLVIPNVQPNNVIDQHDTMIDQQDNVIDQ
jgi:hypothetical protein